MERAARRIDVIPGHFGSLCLGQKEAPYIPDENAVSPEKGNRKGREEKGCHGHRGFSFDPSKKERSRKAERSQHVGAEQGKKREKGTKEKTAGGHELYITQADAASGKSAKHQENAAAGQGPCQTAREGSCEKERGSCCFRGKRARGQTGHREQYNQAGNPVRYV